MLQERQGFTHLVIILIQDEAYKEGDATMGRPIEEAKLIFPGEGKNSFYDVFDVSEEHLKECKKMLGISYDKTSEELYNELQQK